MSIKPPTRSVYHDLTITTPEISWHQLTSWPVDQAKSIMGKPQAISNKPSISQPSTNHKPSIEPTINPKPFVVGISVWSCCLWRLINQPWTNRQPPVHHPSTLIHHNVCDRAAHATQSPRAARLRPCGTRGCATRYCWAPIPGIQR